MDADRDMKRAQVAPTVQQARYEGVKAGVACATGIVALFAAAVTAGLAYLHH